MITSTACTRSFAAVLAGAQAAAGADPAALPSDNGAPAELAGYQPDGIIRVRFGGRAADEPVSAWRRLIAEARGKDEQEKLRLANAFFNRRTVFEDDAVVWRQNDYWATPMETLRRGAGDCEDFSIAKYATLRLMGISDKRLRLVYVRASTGAGGAVPTQAHMVLGYFAAPDADPQVLDNLIDEIRVATRRPDLSPIFSFNSEGWWVGNGTGEPRAPTAPLSRWHDVLYRMHQEELR